MSYRTNLYKRYSGLFGGTDEVDEEIRGETEEEKAERISDEKAQSEKAKKWNWFMFGYILGQGDVLKLAEVYKQNFLYLLTYKSFEFENKKIAEFYQYKKYNIPLK